MLLFMVPKVILYKHFLHVFPLTVTVGRLERCIMYGMWGYNHQSLFKLVEIYLLHARWKNYSRIRTGGNKINTPVYNASWLAQVDIYLPHRQSSQINPSPSCLLVIFTTSQLNTESIGKKTTLLILKCKKTKQKQCL